MGSKLDYIHLNPTRFGILYKAADYLYSSASNYIENKGLLKVELAENSLVDVLLPFTFNNYNSF